MSTVRNAVIPECDQELGSRWYAVAISNRGRLLFIWRGVALETVFDGHRSAPSPHFGAHIFFFNHRQP